MHKAGSRHPPRPTPDQRVATTNFELNSEKAEKAEKTEVISQ